MMTSPPVPRPSNQFRATPFGNSTVDSDGPRTSLLALNDLVRAEDLSVVFQPIVRMDPPGLFAFEALLRCSRPDLTHPEALFDRALEGHCCGRLGRMIREIAIPLCAGIPVFLNIHPQELQDRWLVRPDDPIYTHDSDVYLEITEAVPFNHYELVRDVLREVRGRANVHLVIDDLGAGFSNLKRIADLEPRVVKIDRQLIQGLDNSQRHRTLLRSIVRLCEDLDAEVVAEGIETRGEAVAVHDAGVRFAQGFLYARPAFPLPKPTLRPIPRGAT